MSGTGTQTLTEGQKGSFIRFILSQPDCPEDLTTESFRTYITQQYQSYLSQLTGDNSANTAATAVNIDISEASPLLQSSSTDDISEASPLLQSSSTDPSRASFPARLEDHDILDIQAKCQFTRRTTRARPFVSIDMTSEPTTDQKLAQLRAEMNASATKKSVGAALAGGVIGVGLSAAVAAGFTKNSNADCKQYATDAQLAAQSAQGSAAAAQASSNLAGTAAVNAQIAEQASLNALFTTKNLLNNTSEVTIAPLSNDTVTIQSCRTVGGECVTAEVSGTVTEGVHSQVRKSLEEATGDASGSISTTTAVGIVAAAAAITALFYKFWPNQQKDKALAPSSPQV